MAIWGKIIGAAAGLAIGGPIGALIGAVAGHAYDVFRQEEARRRLTYRRSQSRRRAQGGFEIFSDPAQTRQIAFATALIVLGAKLAKADGVVRKDEIRAFKRVFAIDDREVGDVARIYNHAKTSAEGFEPFARQIGVLFKHDPYLLEQLLSGLFEVARADGELNPAEVAFLRQVGTIFGFDRTSFEQIRARFAATRHRRGDSADAYAVLGLSRSATDDQIKQTYRRLVREHHPDRLVAKGLPEELVAQANRKLAAINAAYDRIEKERALR